MSQSFIPPMLASPVTIDKVQKLIDKGYWAEPKLDGWRCIATRTNSVVELWTRTGKSLTEKLPDIVDELQRLPKRDGDFVFDGEIGYIVKEEFTAPPFIMIDNNKTRRVLGSDAAEARRKQDENGEPPTLVLFDILYGNGRDYRSLSQHERRATLSNAYWDTAYSESELLEISERISSNHLMLYDMYVQFGGEGFMFKNPLVGYESGKRMASTWYKLKKFNTVDVVIMGFTEGQGKYAGQIGAIEFGLYQDDFDKTRTPMWSEPKLVPLGKCSGMDDLVRTQITGDSDDYIGRVLELKYFGKTAGSPQFPQFMRMRTDKDPYECTMETFT